MKRAGNIYERFASRENVRIAIYNAMKGKNHYRDVKQIKKDPEKYIDQLHDLLINRQFKNGQYEIFTRVTGGKERQIFKLPFFPDRVVHHCIIQVVGELWTRSLIRDTYSTIPGRGTHKAAEQVKKAVMDTEGAKFCLKLDIRKYYPSIDNDRLKAVIRRKIKDKYFLELLDGIIDSAPGIPIGNYVSQWFGNLYLSYFDHWIKEHLKCKYYYRYCDDLVLMAPDKDTLFNWLGQIRVYLDQELGLSIKDNYQVFPVKARGVDFLGYRFFPGYTLVRKRILKAMKRKLNDPESMASYFGWIMHADSRRLIQKYFTDKTYAHKRLTA